MLTALPVVLVCFGLQSSPYEATSPNRLVRSASPAAIVTSALPSEARRLSDSRPLHDALQHTRVVPASRHSTKSRAQVGLGAQRMTTADKTMLVLAGAVAGVYAGAYIGEAVDGGDLGTGLICVGVGAAIGGFAVWNLVR